jgi:hypothetical protein
MLMSLKHFSQRRITMIAVCELPARAGPSTICEVMTWQVSRGTGKVLRDRGHRSIRFTQAFGIPI